MGAKAVDRARYWLSIHVLFASLGAVPFQRFICRCSWIPTASYAFGLLHDVRLPLYAIALLRDRVLPAYAEWQIPVRAIITGNGREFFSGSNPQPHSYETYLAHLGIEHGRASSQGSRTPPINGFVKRFYRTTLNEFFAPHFAGEDIIGPIFTWANIQESFDHWLRAYNSERPHIGYRNMGKSPLEVMLQYLTRRSAQPL